MAAHHLFLETIFSQHALCQKTTDHKISQWRLFSQVVFHIPPDLFDLGGGEKQEGPERQAKRQRFVNQRKRYSGVLFKWERFIKMRMAYFAPILSLLPLFFGGRKETSRRLSFEWKILIWIGHYSIFVIQSIQISKKILNKLNSPKISK